MRIETAHKILIASAVAFFVFFGALETVQFLRSRQPSAGLMAACGYAAAAVFAVYLRGYMRRLKMPSRMEERS